MPTREKSYWEVIESKWLLIDIPLLAEGLNECWNN